ncbi:MAG: hypothetical protein AB1801_02400 [Chloroflexota bacterium]
MAGKKKRLTRKEQKEQRQAAIARKRAEKGWTERSSKSLNSHQQELLDDMLPLFPLAGERQVLPEASLEPLMMSLLDSQELAQEPEFQDIIVNPLQCVQTFSEVAQELGIEPDDFSELPDEERGDTHFELLETTIQRLLNDELRQDIIDGLNTLRLRLKQSGPREKVAKVAALQMFLPAKEGSQIWPMVGLVQAIFQRSLAAGFELASVSMQVMEADEPDQDESPLTLAQKLAQSAVGLKFESLLKRVPGLNQFLEKEVDKIWEEGQEALFNGELYLELYSDEELAAAVKIFAETLKIEMTADLPAQDANKLKVTQETGKILITQIDDYITNLFTPERLNQLRARLNEATQDSSFPRQWLAFLAMLAQYMADEDAVKNEKGLLVRTLFGEMRAIQQALLENAETE